MRAVIFVYSTGAQFRIDGTNSIRQFPFEKVPFDQATMIATSGDVKLGRGIYGMFTDSDKVRPEITETSGAVAGTDYDVALLLEKNPWPDPRGAISPTTELQPVYDRAHKQFAQLDDAQLSVFLDEGQSTAFVGQGKATK